MSWSQFTQDYFGGLRLTDGNGRRTPIFVVPGNHEASNAVGYYVHMTPPTDPAPLINIYNLMVSPSAPLTTRTFDYRRDRVFFTRDFGGIHFQFLEVWPDSAMRARMTADLDRVPATTPVMVFTHDQPDVQSKHFVNPNGAHTINDTDKFENLLVDTFADGATVDDPSLVEQSELEHFIAAHPNVTAYFHGNSNWHQVYEWNGPNRSVRLHTVRVDSPMKGSVSAIDETQLSFAVVTIDAAHRVMTVRECLWNRHPEQSGPSVAWGDTVTTTFFGASAR